MEKEAKPIIKYSREYFVEQGRIGGKSSLKKVSKQERRKRAIKAWETKKGLPREIYIEDVNKQMLMNSIERQSKPYRKWRKEVLQRDGNICAICKIETDKPQVDHIKSYRKYPEFRYDISNGRILCKPCHYKTDNFGWKCK